ncbi:hypothetical protein JTB14_001567 [Gonioctena quinquepunctata]|nr:hypothetical protein JTB14_001567 [Gonioctena quinquepunctata]
MGDAEKNHTDHYRIPIVPRDIVGKSRLLERTQGSDDNNCEKSDDDLSNGPLIETQPGISQSMAEGENNESDHHEEGSSNKNIEVVVNFMAKFLDEKNREKHILGKIIEEHEQSLEIKKRGYEALENAIQTISKKF